MRLELLGDTKKPDPFGPGLFAEWWRWAELNRRPKALHPRYYMLIPPLSLVLQQHGGPSAPQNQPVLG